MVVRLVADYAQVMSFMCIMCARIFRCEELWSIFKGKTFRGLKFSDFTHDFTSRENNSPQIVLFLGRRKILSKILREVRENKEKVPKYVPFAKINTHEI